FAAQSCSEAETTSRFDGFNSQGALSVSGRRRMLSGYEPRAISTIRLSPQKFSSNLLKVEPSLLGGFLPGGRYGPGFGHR
ncbi:hypothetical protein, partial [Bradyrhizobium sp. Mp64]|uniref:hypothetical protein n=1 Tax=Bradyrhizobium sp. Mp64 TaxID=3042158 RepID=UPI00248C9CDC